MSSPLSGNPSNHPCLLRDGVLLLAARPLAIAGVVLIVSVAIVAVTAITVVFVAFLAFLLFLPFLLFALIVITTAVVTAALTLRLVVAAGVTSTPRRGARSTKAHNCGRRCARCP